jgi:hypothetical protein
MEKQGPDLPSYLKQLEIYEIMTLKMVDLPQQHSRWWTVIPEKQEAEELGPMVTLDYCLEQVSRWQFM